LCWVAWWPAAPYCWAWRSKRTGACFFCLFLCFFFFGARVALPGRPKTPSIDRTRDPTYFSPCLNPHAIHDHSYHVQRTLRLWPKANPLILSLTWVGNAAFALLAAPETVARYTLFLVISGALLGNVVSLALGRPVLLEEAIEAAESRVCVCL
jgi:hypothetical protein